MPYSSDIQKFHNMYKNPDLYYSPEEKARVHRMIEEDKKLKQKKGENEAEISEKKEEVITSAGKNFEETVSLVQSATLLPEFIDDTEELKIIEQRKEAILKFLSATLENVTNYLNQVNYYHIRRSDSYDSTEKYQEAMRTSDSSRRQLHNKLVQGIKIAVRLININFNADFPEEIRLREEAKMPDRQNISTEKLAKLMKERQYFKFPYSVGGFIDFKKIPRDPDGEREYVASWALNIYSDLTALHDIVKEYK